MVCVLLVAAAGCAWWVPEIVDPADAEFVASDLPRDTNPQPMEQEIEDVVIGNGEFAFDLLGELSAGGGNVFFSPYSVSSALAMTYAAARGSTETQMADVLHFDPMGQTVHPVFNWLDLQLAERDEVSPPFEGDGLELSIANAVWGQKGHGFLQEYLDTLAVSYGAGLRLIDFAGDPEGSRVEINDWVSEETRGRIEDLLGPDAINADTRLVLTNAIYFTAPWLKPFDEAQTREELFATLGRTSCDGADDAASRDVPLCPLRHWASRRTCLQRRRDLHGASCPR